MKHYNISSLEDTRNLAENLAKTIRRGDTLFLSGELGAGKTTFAKYLCVALGVQENVTSPTYTISRNYTGKNMQVLHIDLYRLISDKTTTSNNYIITQLENCFYEETLEDGIALIEWGETIAQEIVPRIEVNIIRNTDEIRSISIKETR